ncbi:MAG: MaoC family dehydratase [Pseudomonadota bacterium]
MTDPTDRDLWFEDFAPGQVFRTESATVTEGMILDFAQRWDPQSFHMDVGAAAESQFGGLISSGFQTLLIAFRLWHALRVGNPSSQGSPGMEEVRWLAPVRPGDSIRDEVTVVAARVSASRPGLGLVTWRHDVYNQRDEKVLTWTGPVFHRLRPDAPPD